MKSTHLKLLLAAALLCAPALAQAPAAAPSAAEVKKVLDFYYTGKDLGPVLVELVACTKVDNAKDSPTKNECVEPVKDALKKGTTVHAWTVWMVPEGGSYEDVVIQYLHEGQVRTTADVKLLGGYRARTWRAANLSKPGKWEIKVMRGATELGSTLVTVNKD